MNTKRIEQLTQSAIRFIQKAEPLALRMDERGFHVAFSGGKDSQVILKLVEMANVRYHAEMQVTTVDSPNLMKFVRANYPQVTLNRPELNMIQLIQKKGMLPTRLARYCCAYLKEGAGAGTVTVVGIRAKESVNRAKRNPVEVLGQRGKGFHIEGDKLYTNNELPNGGGKCCLNNRRTRKFIALAARTRLLFPQSLIGLNLTCGHSSTITTSPIVICMTRDSTALDAFSVRWHHPRKRKRNLKCSHVSRKRCTSGQSGN